MKVLLFAMALFFLGYNNSYTQSKTVDVYVPNNLTKHSFDESITIYRIKTNEFGIINSITSINNDEFIIPEITVGEDEIRIWSDRDVYAINIMNIENSSLYVKGGERSIYTRNGNQFMEIKIQPDSKTIFEHDEIFLTKGENNVLQDHFKINPSNFFGYNYSDNTLIIDYRYADNPNFKYVYERKGNTILVTYFYNMGEFIEYPSKIEIHGNIYSSEMKVNIINYFITTGVRSLLSGILFPLFFLENPIL
ncbi:MAG: hypothetical protein LBQ46_03725 [Treponema sp.]|jgi:hypothetical protein|nr:hypothetical protein [Treponema sp.]